MSDLRQTRTDPPKGADGRAVAGSSKVALYIENGNEVTCPTCREGYYGTVQARTMWMRRHEKKCLP